MSLTFVVGTAADVFGAELAHAIDAKLAIAAGGVEAYRSEPVDATGWRALQTRVLRTLDVAPQLTSVDAYQAVYVPGRDARIEHVPVGTLADPLQVASLDALLEELRRFAAAASLPTDDLELMKLAAELLEADEPDPERETYVQLMLSAKQAWARKQALWVVV